MPQSKFLLEACHDFTFSLYKRLRDDYSQTRTSYTLLCSPLYRLHRVIELLCIAADKSCICSNGGAAGLAPCTFSVSETWNEQCAQLPALPTLTSRYRTLQGDTFTVSLRGIALDREGEFQRRAHWAPFVAWSVSQSNDFRFFAKTAHRKLDRLLVPSPPSSPPPIGSSRSLEGKLSPFLSHFSTLSTLPPR